MSKSITISGFPYSIDFEHMETVYLKTDPDQMERLVTQVILKPYGTVMYELSYDNSASYHYDFEISKERNVIKVTTN